MSKKSAIIIAAVLALVLLVGALSACNKLKWEGVGGGDPTAPVESQFGFVIKQGNYIYFINGYVGVNEDNTFGKQVKGGIMRMELDENGVPKADTSKLLVPMNVYTSDKNVGFAIYGKYIYYAAPNTEKDRAGNPSTKHLSIMRSDIDGGNPVRLLVLDNRDIEYKFYKDAIVYYDSTGKALYYADLSSGKADAAQSSLKKIAGNVADPVFSYEKNEKPAIADYIVYTATRPAEEGEFYHELRAVKFDGTGSTLLADKSTYLPEGETDHTKFPGSVYQYTIVSSILDGDDLVIYYTKQIFENQTTATRGLFMNKITLENGMPSFKVATEKELSGTGTNTALTPLGYDEGALLAANSNIYLIVGYAPGGEDPNTYDSDSAVVGKSLSPTVLFVKDGYLYYLQSAVLYRIDIYNAEARAEKLSSAISLATSWITADIVGDGLYYFNSKDYTYTYRFDLTAEDGDEEGAFLMLGYMNDEDTQIKKEAEELNK